MPPRKTPQRKTKTVAVVEPVSDDAVEKKPKAKQGARGTGIGRGRARKSKTTTQRRTKKTESSPQHPSVPETVARNQKIVHDREVLHMTWTEIAAQHEVTEKTARDGYRQYVEEIAPLIDSDEAFATMRMYVRTFEGLRSQVAKLARKTKNEAVELGAWARVADLMMKEIEFRQKIGLLPADLSDLSVIVEREWLAKKIREVLERHDTPVEVYQELHEVMVAAR